MMGYGGGWGWGWLYGALLLIGLALLVVVAVRLLGSGVRREVPRDERGRALHLLDERYARGEIDTEEYQERRRALGDGG
jgi:putative membrane protein